MRKLLSMLFSVAISLTVCAADYDAIWKKYCEAVEKDMYQDAQEQLRKIEKLAENDPVLAAVYHTIRKDYDKALSNPDLLAKEKSTPWKRIINKGTDDSLWNNDLLSIIGHQAGRYAFLKNYYDSIGNREAACVELYLEVRNMDSRRDDLSRTNKRRMLEDGMRKYSDLEEVALLAQEYYDVMLSDDDISRQTCHAYLKECIGKYNGNKYSAFFNNALDNLTRPQFEMSLKDKLIIPSVRNIGKLTIEFLPLRSDGRLKLNPNNKKELNNILKLVSGQAVQTLSRDYSSHNPWEIVKDTIDCPAIPVGMYLVKTSANNLTAYEVLHNSDITLLTLPLDKNSTRIAAVSSKTGKGIPGCTIVVTNDRNGKSQTKVADKNGELILNLSFDPDRIYAYTSTDKAFKESYFRNSVYCYKSKEEKDIITLFTDRAIYRPGQTIKGSAVVHKAADIDDIHTLAGRQVRITIQDAEYKEIHTDSIITDAHGNAGFEFTIPKILSKNGMFTISAATSDSAPSSTYVNVEEYKRPTFEVNAVDDKTLFADKDSVYVHGDSVSVAFDAKTFSLLPVANADVEYTISRQSRFFRFGQSRLIADKVKATTDSNGRIVIPVSITLPEEGFGLFVYDITAKVTAPNGESREARTHVMARTKDFKGRDFLIPANNGAKKEERPVFEVSAKSFPHKGNVIFSVKDSASTEPLHVFCSFYADGNAINHERFTVKGSYSKALNYTKEYGDNLSIRCMAVRDGKVYSFSETIMRPQPDLQLNPVWTTFRDRTQPGAMETWSLNIRSGKGKGIPASSASLIATIYDKSLDLEARHNWNIQVIRNYFSLSSYWRAMTAPGFYSSRYATQKNLTEKVISYASFKPELLYYSEEDMAFSPRYAGGIRIRGAQPLMMAKARVAPTYAKEEMADYVSAENALESAKEAKAEDEGSGDNAPAEDLSTLVRTDLGETAWFTPSLVADKDGNITMSFRMPETMTTWRFLGFVHDDKMRHAFIDTTCVAQKAVIVRPNVPRFLRNGDNKDGDRPVFAATVSNTTDKAVNTNVIMQLLTADAETVVWEQKTTVTINGGSSEAVSFEAPATTSKDSVLVYRIVAKTDEGASDGEQHYIPVLPAVEETISTIAFTQRGENTFTTDIRDLLINGSTERRMTVRYTPNAERVVLDAIPHIIRPAHKDVLSVASAVYVASMFPAQTTDTLRTSLVKELQKLQLSDGSWSWWKGMSGSVYMTANVAKYLARLQQKYLGSPETNGMLDKAMPFLLKELGEEVKNIRKRKSTKGIHPSETATDILYICALQKYSGKTFDKKAEEDIKFLIGLMEKVPMEYTIYGKAHSAVILALYGKKTKAKEFIESMRQYSVYTPEAGRYYDTRKAYYSWRNYKIPTEVAAIEALRIVCPEDVRTVEEMQQWLLHEKRTQQWDNSANTADAVWAFISGNNDLDLSRDIAYSMTIGGKSVKDGDTVDIEAGKTVFSASKESKGTAWGGLLVTQRAPLSSVKTHGTGFSVKREIAGNDDPAVGDKVIVRITINADRDYDFVKVTDNRAACLEPVQQISGYQSAKTGGTARGSWSGYYRETKDNMTNYYFDRMAKGTHIIETEYFVDREGKYRQGTCTVSCAYAPEFSATEAPKTIVTKSAAAN